uniref:FERM domain-containing protein n=1 Tax=Haemonchus placei TaxID=6290 RepID=A0A0N4VRV0_HAEPC
LFEKWHGVVLNSTSNHKYWIPDRFGHGFQEVMDGAQAFYKCTAVYDQITENRSLRQGHQRGVAAVGQGNRERPRQMSPKLSDIFLQIVAL